MSLSVVMTQIYNSLIIIRSDIYSYLVAIAYLEEWKLIVPNRIIRIVRIRKYRFYPSGAAFFERLYKIQRPMDVTGEIGNERLREFEAIRGKPTKFDVLRHLSQNTPKRRRQRKTQITLNPENLIFLCRLLKDQIFNIES